MGSRRWAVPRDPLDGGETEDRPATEAGAVPDTRLKFLLWFVVGAGTLTFLSAFVQHPDLFSHVPAQMRPAACHYSRGRCRASVKGTLANSNGSREKEKRGSQVSVRFGEGYAVVQAMIAQGVIGDFRAADIMRFGFSPLHTSFTETWDAAECLAQCIGKEVWREERFTRRTVVT